MKLQYYPETDTLYISLRERVSVESDEVAEDVVVDYGDDGRPVGIEIEHASKLFDLTKLEAHSLPVTGWHSFDPSARSLSARAPP